MPDVTQIRKAAVRDVSGILDLQTQAFLGLASTFYSLDLMHEVLREVPLFSVDLIDEGHYFVLEGPNGKVLGSGGWSQKMPSYKSAVAAAKPTFGRVAITRSVYVHPASARQGFGRRIMQHIETDAIDHGMTRMTMTATLSGMPLYRRIGYRVTDKQCAVLESGARVDLYGMEKPLIGENARAA